jgi:hypothetical protein
MSALKRKVIIELGKISGMMFQKSIMNIKKRRLSWLGWSASILRAGGKLWRNKTMKSVIN